MDAWSWMVMAAVTSMDTVMRAMHSSVHPVPANCPGTPGTVLDLLLLSPAPHTTCYLPRMSPATQTISGTGTVASYAVQLLIFVVISTYYHNHNI